MPYIRVNGVELYYEMLGEIGDPLVLVHGSWVDHSTFDLVAPILSHGFRVLAYDRRGHGRSERPGQPRTISDDVADLAGLLEGVDFHPAHVAGNSLGGSIALQLAAHRPELLRSLTAHEAPLLDLVDGPSEELDRARDAMAEVTALVAAGDARGAARTFVDAVGIGPGAWDRLPATTQELLVAHAASWPPEYYDRSAATVERTLLANFDSPALITTGELGLRFFREISDRLLAALPNAEARLLPGTGHVPHLTHPSLYVGTLVQFCLERSVPPT